MNSTKKIQQKVFLKKTPKKYSQSLEDWDISDDVLSEANARAPQVNLTLAKSVSCRLGISNSSSNRHNLWASSSKICSSSKEENKLAQPEGSKFKKHSPNSKSRDKLSEKNSEDISDGRKISLRSEISSLLQQLIRQRSNSATPVKGNKKTKLIKTKKSTFHIRYKSNSSARSGSRMG